MAPKPRGIGQQYPWRALKKFAGMLNFYPSIAFNSAANLYNFSKKQKLQGKV
jgi:hypothetical protein